MTGQKVGYKRVSSIGQNTERQLEGLSLDRIFEEKVSGRSIDRPELVEMVAYVRQGDEVYVHSMDRLGRNLRDLLEITSRLTAKGVRISFIKENLILTGDDGPIAQLMLQLMGAFAEFERRLILERQREGIALAKQRHVYKGRKPKLSPRVQEEIKKEAESGTNKSELAKKYSVSRQTLYNVLKSPA